MTGGFHAGGIEQGDRAWEWRYKYIFCGDRKERFQQTIYNGKFLIDIIDTARLLLQDDVFRRTVVVVYDKVPVLFRGGN